MFKRIIKGLGKGILNVLTGGIIDSVKETKVAKKVSEIANSGETETYDKNQLYKLLDLYDDGKLNNSFSQKKAELISKAIGGFVTALILAWALVSELLNN